MKLLFTKILFLLCAGVGFAQEDSSFQLWKSYSGQVTDATLDNLDNLYLLTASDQLKKFSAQGDSVAVYNNVRKLGKVHTMNVSNPLKVLLYYKDFSTIVILDRMLSVRATLDLRRQNILQASAMSLSYDNNIWLFDGYENKLKKIDEEGNLLLETPDFRPLFGEAVSPQQIIDQNNLLYLYDSARGLYIFDRYGTFKRKVPVTGWSSLTVSDKFIVGITGNKSLRSYNLSTLLESDYAFPGSFSSYNRFYLKSNKVIAIAKDSVHVYAHQLH